VIVASSPLHKNEEALQAWALKWSQQGTPVWLQKNVGAVEAWPEKTNRLRSFLNGEEFFWTAKPGN